jgi:lysozyme family protein
MTDRWRQAITLHLRAEGGESRRPPGDDPGGWTRFGITAKRWCGEGRSLDAFEALDPESAAAWYRERIWLPARCDDWASDRLALAWFTWAAGPLGEPRATICLQSAINRLRAPELILSEDGILGPSTRRATDGYPSVKALTAAFKVEIALYLSTRPHWPANRNGWMARLDEC